MIEKNKKANDIIWQDWGCLDYHIALSRQETTLLQVQSGETGDTVIFCTHPPVVTLGRATQDYEYADWSGDLLSINRGGRSTYHGPSQLVIYPIVDLNQKSRSELRRARDIGSYLRLFERVLVETVSDYGVIATGRSSQKRDRETSPEEATGVWVKEKKLASLGIGIKKWCTFHGAAINLHKDDEAFKGVYPCGFNSNVMVSLEELTGEKIDQGGFVGRLKKKMTEIFL